MIKNLSWHYANIYWLKTHNKYIYTVARALLSKSIVQYKNAQSVLLTFWFVLCPVFFSASPALSRCFSTRMIAVEHAHSLSNSILDSTLILMATPQFGSGASFWFELFELNVWCDLCDTWIFTGTFLSNRTCPFLCDTWCELLFALIGLDWIISRVAFLNS